MKVNYIHRPTFAMFADFSAQFFCCMHAIGLYQRQVYMIDGWSLHTSSLTQLMKLNDRRSIYPKL
jgi:hypothetical protein